MGNAMDIGDLQDRRLSAEELGERLREQEIETIREDIRVLTARFENLIDYVLEHEKGHEEKGMSN